MSAFLQMLGFLSTDEKVSEMMQLADTSLTLISFECAVIQRLYVPVTQMFAFMQRLGSLSTDEEVAEMVKLADTNSDGVVDFEEFKVLMAKCFCQTESECIPATLP